MLFYMQLQLNKTVPKLIKTITNTLNAGGLQHRLHDFATDWFVPRVCAELLITLLL